MEIQFQEVSVTLDGHPILKRVTTTIPSGATVTVVGPSGCGKSTFLKLINGLMAPTSGRILIDRQPLNYHRILSIRRRMGYVMQEAGLLPHLSVKENVSLLARLEVWPEEKVQAQVEKWMRLVNLEDPKLLSRWPRSLSGGQRQRVAIARALMLDPPILLMDEPFSALDPIVRRELQEEFVRLKTILHRTVVLVTHDFAEAYRLGDRILLLNEGRIDQEDAPEEFVAHPVTPLAEKFVTSARGI